MRILLRLCRRCRHCGEIDNVKILRLRCAGKKKVKIDAAVSEFCDLCEDRFRSISPETTVVKAELLEDLELMRQQNRKEFKSTFAVVALLVAAVVILWIWMGS